MVNFLQCDLNQCHETGTQEVGICPEMWSDVLIARRGGGSPDIFGGGVPSSS